MKIKDLMKIGYKLAMLKALPGKVLKSVSDIKNNIAKNNQYIQKSKSVQKSIPTNKIKIEPIKPIGMKPIAGKVNWPTLR